jgi:hypothetical protein
MFGLREGLAPGKGHNADGMLMIYMRVCNAVNAGIQPLQTWEERYTTYTTKRIGCGVRL